MLDSPPNPPVRPRLSRWRRLLRVSILVVGVALLGCGLTVGWRRATGNIGVIEPGRLYRSAQLDPAALGRLIRAQHIKTVVNLRGANPDEPWYRAELAATLAQGATQVDIPLASDQWLSREQVETLLDVIDHSETPILFHCEFGAERTGLVASLVTLLRPGSRIEDGRAQFSLAHLFLPIGDGRTMIGHLDTYEQWLHDHNFGHSPEKLRVWLASDYRPGNPSREHWPCNPYPRKVVSQQIDGRSQTQVEHSAHSCPNVVASDAGPPRR